MAKAITVLDEFKGTLDKQNFKSILPDHVHVDKFKAVVITAVQRKPDLLTLNRASLFVACQDCAKDGLIPDGREAALIPSKGKVRYSPMVAGITKKARNSGEILTIDAIVVCENDDYDSWVDEKGQHFKHRKLRSGDRGKDVMTYAYAITKDGGFYFEEINEEQMAAIEKCCTAKTTPWKGPFRSEMKRKSALHRLCKYRLPSSTDLIGVISRDNDMYDLDDPAEEQPKGNDAPPAKSTLENTVGDAAKEDISDAEIVESKKEPEPIKGSEEYGKSEGEIKKMQVEGKITSVIEKKLVEKTKYGCKVGDFWYGSFSSTVYGKMIEAEKQKCDVRIIFEVHNVGERKVNDIVSLETLWPEEVAQPGEKPDVPDDEIAI